MVGKSYNWLWYICVCLLGMSFFCFKQKTAYEMRISDWSSDVCSSDLLGGNHRDADVALATQFAQHAGIAGARLAESEIIADHHMAELQFVGKDMVDELRRPLRLQPGIERSEEHTSELQSLMRISYAVFCFTQKHYTTTPHINIIR